MLSGSVLETIDTGVVVWMRVRVSKGEHFTCGIERSDAARSISPRDMIALRSGRVYWSPAAGGFSWMHLGKASGINSSTPASYGRPISALEHDGTTWTPRSLDGEPWLEDNGEGAEA